MAAAFSPPVRCTRSKHLTGTAGLKAAGSRFAALPAATPGAAPATTRYPTRSPPGKRTVPEPAAHFLVGLFPAAGPRPAQPIIPEPASRLPARLRAGQLTPSPPPSHRTAALGRLRPSDLFATASFLPAQESPPEAPGVSRRPPTTTEFRQLRKSIVRAVWPGVATAPWWHPARKGWSACRAARPSIRCSLPLPPPTPRASLSPPLFSHSARLQTIRRNRRDRIKDIHTNPP